MKELVRRSLSRMVVHSGLTALRRRLRNQPGALILYGHRVRRDDEGYLEALRPEWLAAHLEYLARHYSFLSLSELTACLENGSEVPRNSVVVTFDDGFRDNLELAFPVLQRYRVPATIFLVTGSISGGHLPWSQRLGVLFEHTREPELRHELAGPAPLPLTTDRQRRTAYLRVKGPLSKLSRGEREHHLEALGAHLGVEAPRDRMLSWDDVRTMAAGGIEFGAHTYSHPLLANIPPDEAAWEMERSRDDLAEHLGVEHPPFAFPGGSSTPELVATAKELGFRSAFQSRPSLRYNGPHSTSAFSLSRIGFPNAPAWVLEAELDGPFHTLRSLYRR